MHRAALLGLLLSLTLSAHADESFLVNVPLGEDLSRLIGEVRVTLGLNGPPAGAQLLIAETTTVTLGQTVNLAGDTLTFEAGAGNEVRITFRPLTNFNAPGNFCDAHPQATPKEIQIRFVGSQDVVEYRISSYKVGAPDVECSQPYRRFGEFPAFLVPFADSSAPELTALAKGRHELDVVFVLDKSGSMAGLPPSADDPPASPASKAEILRSAIRTFVAQWQQIDAPVVDGEAEWMADRIGLVFFDSTAVPQTIDGSFFVERGPGGAAPEHQWNAVMEQIDMLAPGGSTTIGGGINTGMERWQLDPDHDLAVVVVTDGQQNTAPLIERVNDILTLTPVAGFDGELRKRFTPIYTIGFGTPAAVDQALLQDISLQTTGVSFLAIDAGTMFDSFALTLVNLLKGNTISLALRQNGTMTGTGPSATHTVTVDRSVPRLVVSVQWAPPRRDGLDLEVIGPDGTERTPASTARPGQAVVQRFELRPEDTGDWQVRVKRGQSTATESIPYTLNAFLLEGKLEYQLTFDRMATATGDAIQVRAHVAYDHRALNKLPGNAIRVRVQRPSAGLGTILHDTRVDDTGGVPMNGDTQSPYERKVSAITNAALLERVYPRDVETLTLHEEKPGLYTGTFNGTNVPGMYAFEATLDWDDPRTGRVKRVERLEKHVKVKPDPQATIVSTMRADDGPVLVAVTPRDRFGNYTGPGYGSTVRATLNGPGTISSAPADPDQTGTYVFTVDDVPAGETPDVTVTVDGVNVSDGASSTGKWRVFADLGINFPDRLDGKWSLNLGIERILTPHWSIEAIAGHHTFDHPADPHVEQLSVNVKYFFGMTRLRPYLNGGPGAYQLKPGHGGTRAGFNAGAGLFYALTPRWGLEAAYNYHTFNTQADSFKFSTVQGGVRVGF